MSLIKKIFTRPLLAFSALLTACSGSTEDVRLTLCKDLTADLVGSAGQFEILSEDIVIDKYEDLEVRLKYQAESRQGQAVCFYPYNTVEENVMDHVNPAEAFATYPNRVVLDGADVDHRLVAKKVNEALLKQGKAVIDSVKDKL